MAYKIKLKHILMDLDDGEFKTEKEFMEALEPFTVEDYKEHFRKEFSTDSEKEEEELM
jgi:hypothetical protein